MPEKESKKAMSKFDDFAKLHVAGDPLVLFNVWDAGSARVFEDAGAKAVATTSAGMAWALGYQDGIYIRPRETAERGLTSRSTD